MKTYIKTGINRGALFAVGMALWEYFDDGVFSLFKFIFHFSFFGISMGLFDYFAVKRKKKNN